MIKAMPRTKSAVDSFKTDGGPVVRLVHSTPIRGDDPIVAPAAGLRTCDPSESLLDIQVTERSLVELGASLADPIRVSDMFLLHRLLEASRWNIPIPAHRLCDSLTDPSAFGFAEDFVRRGYGDMTLDGVKNGIKRLRDAFEVARPSSPRTWFIQHCGRRGYLFNINHIRLEVLHIPQ